MSLLTAKSVTKHFGGLKAVQDVDFELEAGEVRAIIGPNGAGKTTFVSMLCGRLEVTRGEIFFKDQNITEVPAYQRVRAGIAYTFQITSIYSNLSVSDNIAIALRNRISSETELAMHVQALLNLVGLAEVAQEVAGNLAYGHQRILEVAMGLAVNPDLLILDEPTQGLSDSEIAQFCELIKDISQSKTILLIEHNMHVVMSVAKKITVFDQGRILAEGDPESIQNNEKVQQAYLGT